MTYKANTQHMQAAINDVLQHLPHEPGGPFGACIVKDGQIIAVAHNTVLENSDATCHAEINAIRLASQALHSHNLSGCVIYSTTEPCPMCFSAIHWAQIERIVFGSRIADVKALGFNELSISNDILKQQGGSSVLIEPDFMRQECLDLLQVWQSTTAARVY